MREKFSLSIALFMVLASITAHAQTPSVTITQTTPASGSIVGPLNFNEFSINNQLAVTGSSADHIYPNNSANGLRVDYTTGGSNVGGYTQTGIYSHMMETLGNDSAGDLTAVIGSAYTNVVNSGIAGFDGVVGSSNIDNGGYHYYSTGVEANSGILTGGSGALRFSLNMYNTGQVEASTVDSAIGLANFSTASGAYKNLITLWGTANEPPLAPTANLFNADGPMTVANIFNLPNMTVTGNYFNFPGFTWTAGGQVNVTNSVNGNSPSIMLLNTSTGPAADTFFQANNGAYALTMGMTGAGWGGAPLYTSGRGFVTSGGTALVVGTSTSNPLIFAINNVQALELTAAGALQFSALPTGTPSTYACFTSTGVLISSPTACN